MSNKKLLNKEKRFGRWEIDYFSEPIYGLSNPDGSPCNMFMISDEKSYFVFTSHVAGPNESIKEGIEIAWKEAISKDFVLPNSILVKKEGLVDYLSDITKEFNIQILYVKKLKAIPDAIRTMKRMFPKSDVSKFAPVVGKPNKHDLYYEAMELMCAGNSSEAINLLLESLKLDPHYVNAYQGLSSVYRERGDTKMYRKYVLMGYQETQKFFNKWPKELSWFDIDNRQYIRAIFNMATLHIENNEFEKGIELYRHLLSMCPHDGIGARYYVALLYDGRSIEEIETMWDWANKKQKWDVMENLLETQNKIHKFWKRLDY